MGFSTDLGKSSQEIDEENQKWKAKLKSAKADDWEKLLEEQGLGDLDKKKSSTIMISASTADEAVYEVTALLAEHKDIIRVIGLLEGAVDSGQVDLLEETDAKKIIVKVPKWKEGLVFIEAKIKLLEACSEELVKIKNPAMLEKVFKKHLDVANDGYKKLLEKAKKQKKNFVDPFGEKDEMLSWETELSQVS